jgi:hypothetical protein
VRHVRMLGLCLVAAFAVSAMAAMPALAAKFSTKTWSQYKGCPYNNPEVEFCFAGITAGGSEGGYFQLGNVTVKLNKPVTLQGGANGSGEEVKIFPATNGFQTLESPELKVEKGLAVITPRIENEVGWPEALKQSFAEAKKNKEAGLNVKIEVAGGNEIYEQLGTLSTQNLIEEHGPAFSLPLKVKITGPWLAKLGGGPCEIGSETHPVFQFLTSENPGRPGSLEEGFEFANIELNGSRLIDVGWNVEEAAEANGCGSGENEAFVDAAIDRSLEVPFRHGITVLQGSTFAGNVKAVKEAAERGEVH